MTTQNQNSQFVIYFGHDRILDKVTFTTLAQVFQAISENIFMFTNDCFQFSENSITIEMQVETENNNFIYEKFLKIPTTKFNLIKKMNLGIY